MPNPVFSVEIPVIEMPLLLHLFEDKQDLMILHSASTQTKEGRYSFVCFDAFATLEIKENKVYYQGKKINHICPFALLKKILAIYPVEASPSLPPFQGGAVGYLGYEASSYLEKVPAFKEDLGLPRFYWRFYSHLIAIDHHKKKSWIIATGFPAKRLRKKQALQQIAAVQERLLALPLASKKPTFWQPLSPPASNFTAETYAKAVEETQAHILQGDIFEANISQQFHLAFPAEASRFALYQRLVTYNPAPFGGFFSLPEKNALLLASPERFLRLQNNQVQACPIKGTQKRVACEKEDVDLQRQLQQSAKDRAENIMIVDLMRNDLSKVCIPESIQVPSLCALQSFATVHHLVSTITGTLAPSMCAVSLLKATFPPGSMTGAPKIRAMEIIHHIEKKPRGPYAGTFGYIGFTGNMDLAVTIRSFFLAKGNVYYSAGGAVVLDSSPEEEYRESMNKAFALMEALCSS